MKRFAVVLLCALLAAQAFTVSYGESVIEPEPAQETVEIRGGGAEPMPNEMEEGPLASPDPDVARTGPEAGETRDDAPAEASAETPETPVVPASLTLGVKEKYTLGIPGATFNTSKKSVASVSGKGVVTGRKKGTAIITAFAGSAELGQCRVKVLPAPGRVTLSAEKLTLTVGGTGRLQAKLPKKTASRIAWSSSDDNVATVDADGVVTPLRPGWVTITARTFNGKKAACAVTVLSENDPKSLSLPVKSLTLGVKEKAQITPEVNDGAEAAFAWASKNSKVATVSKAGQITGKKTGSTKITVRTQNGLKATVSVKVLKAPASVTLSAKKARIAVDGTVRLKAKLPKNSASRIEWASSDDNVATVDADGVVTGISSGTAKITARTFNGKKAACTVAVQAVDDALLREKAVGKWEVTAAKVFGVEAEAYATLITLELRADGTCDLTFHGHGGFPAYSDTLEWTARDGAIVIGIGNETVMRLPADRDVSRLAFPLADDVVYYFTRGAVPVSPTRYPKYETGPEDVNGLWVADRVSYLSLGLTFKAEEIGEYAAIGIKDYDVAVAYRSEDGTIRRQQSEAWYANGQVTLLDGGELLQIFYYYEDLDAISAMLPESENEKHFWFRREREAQGE